MAKKIAIANTKGGIGKTSTAIALADGLKAKNKKVLMIDSDPHSMSSTGVYKAKTEGEKTLAEVLYEKLPAIEAIQHTEYGDIIPSDRELAYADTKVPVDADTFYRLSDACKSIEDKFDYIIIDCPPGNGIILGNVLTYADEIIIPITCDSFGIKCLDSFKDIYELYSNRLNPKLKILGILITMYEGRQSLTRDLEENIIPEEVKKLKTTLFKTRIRKSVKLKESQLMNTPVYKYAKNSTVALDYKDFVDEYLRKTKRSH